MQPVLERRATLVRGVTSHHHACSVQSSEPSHKDRLLCPPPQKKEDTFRSTYRCGHITRDHIYTPKTFSTETYNTISILLSKASQQFSPSNTDYEHIELKKIE